MVKSMTNTTRTTLLQQIFGNPVWGFLGTIATVLALIISIYSAYWSRPQKALQSTVLAQVLPTASGTKDIKVLYKGNDVDNFSVFIVRLENIGNQPVKVEDYYRPITFLFPKDSRILYVNKVESIPTDIEIRTSIDGNSASLFPFLLNRDDKVILEIGVLNATQEFPPFAIQQRILDINEIKVVNAFEGTKFPVYLPFLIIAISIFINMISSIGRRIRLDGKQLSINVERPISYQTLSISEQKLFSVANKLRNKNNIYVVKIKIKHTGTFPVTDSSSMRLGKGIWLRFFLSNSKVIEGKIDTQQKFTKAKVEFDGNEIGFYPELINPEDEVLITCLVQSAKKPKVLFDRASKRIAKIKIN